MSWPSRCNARTIRRAAYNERTTLVIASDERGAVSHATMASHASTVPLADLAVRIGLFQGIGRSGMGACLPAPTQICRQQKLRGMNRGGAFIGCS